MIRHGVTQRRKIRGWGTTLIVVTLSDGDTGILHCMNDEDARNYARRYEAPGFWRIK